jgi:hypothetical protein
MAAILPTADNKADATLQMYHNIKRNMEDMYGTETVQSLTDENGFVMNWHKGTDPCMLTVKMTPKGKMKVAFSKNLAEGVTNTKLKEQTEGKAMLRIDFTETLNRNVLVWNPPDSDTMYGIWDANCAKHNVYDKTAEELASQMLDILCCSFVLQE